MTGRTKYIRIPFITKMFKIKLFIYWVDDKFKKIGFKKDVPMTFEQAFLRLERKRMRRESS